MIDSWRKIELSGKNVPDWSPYCSNETRQGTCTQLLLSSIFKKFKLPYYCWVITILSLQSSLGKLPSSEGLSLLILLLFILFKSVCHLRNAGKSAKDQDNREYKHWNGESFSNVRSKDIKVGHIISLSNEETAPADLLILTSFDKGSDEEVTFLDVNGDIVQKKHVEVINDFCMSVDLYQLRGIVKVDHPSRDFKTFRGKAQLTTNFKEHNINFNNFVHTGSVFKAVGVVICLVVYTGIDTKLWARPRQKTSAFELRLNKTAVILITLYALFACLFLILKFYLQQNHFFQTEAVDILEIMVYNYSLVPLNLLVFYEFVKLIQTLKVKKRFKSNDMLEELGNIDKVVFSDTVFEETYRVSIHETAQRNENNCPLELDSEAVQGIALSSLVSTNKESFISAFQDDVLVAQFAQDMGCTIKAKNSSYCTLIQNSNKIYYHILGFKEYSKNSKHSSVLILDRENNCSIFTKGRCKHIRHMQSACSAHVEGDEFLVIASRRLSYEEYLDFCHLYEDTKIGRKNIQKKKAEVFSKFENNLQVLCVLKIKLKVPEYIKSTLSYLNKANIKTWLVSHKASGNVTTKAMKLGFLSFNYKKLKYRGDMNKFKESILKHFQALVSKETSKLDLTDNKIGEDNSNFPSVDSEEEYENSNCNIDQTHYSVTIDSSSYEVALQDEDIKRILISVLLAANSVCFFDFNPQQKAEIVKMLQQSTKEKVSVMAVGSSLEDFPMLNQSNLGMSLTPGVTDIHSENLEELMRMILQDGYWALYRISNLSLVFIYQAFLVSGVSIPFFVVSDYSGTQIIENPSCYFLTWMIVLPQMIYIGIKDRIHSSKEIMNSLKWSRKKQFNPRNIIKYGTTGATQGLVIWLLLLYGCPEIIYEKGQGRDLEYISICAFLVISLLVTFELYLISSKKNPLSIISLFAGLGLISLTFLMLYYTQNSLIIQVMSVPLTFLIVPCAFLSCQIVRMILSMLFSIRPLAKCLSKDRNSGEMHPFPNKPGGKDNNQNGFCPIMMKFYRFEHEQLYNKQYSDKNIKLFRMIMLSGAVGCFILFIKFFIEDVHGYFFHIRYFLLMLAFLSTFFLTLLKSMRKFMNSLLLVDMAIVLIILIVSIQAKDTDLYLGCAFPTLSYHCARNSWRNITIGNMVHMLMILLTVLSYDDPLDMITVLLYFIGFTVISGTIAYEIEYSNRKEFALSESIANVAERKILLLRTLLPDFVLRRVKDGTRYIAEEKGLVSVLFCYICDFEFISADYSASELSDFLNHLFNQFDLICQHSGTVKIETVGNTYMACAGLKDCEEFLDEALAFMSQADRLISAGCSILDTASRTKLKNGDSLKLKIGIHSGEVTAGVVGFHKPQFSLVGDTVNTASRMSSTASANSIQISYETKQLVTIFAGLDFVESTVEAKGKGLLDTFIVHRNSPSLIQKENLPVSLFCTNSPIPGDVSSFKKEIEHHDIGQFKKYFDAQSETKSVFAVQLIVFLSYLFIGLISLASPNKFTILVGFYTGASLLTMVLMKTIYTNRLYRFIIVPISLSPFVYRMANHSEISEDFLILEQVLWLLFIIYGQGLDMKATVLHSLLVMLLIDSYYAFLHNNESWVIEAVIFIVFLEILSIYSVHTIRNLRLKEFCLKAYDKKELEVTEQLLINLMPQWVLSDLMLGKEINDELKQVTLLYADIVGFTAYSASRTPNEIIEMLSRLFTQFDQLCITYNLYKVYTIGDCYVVMSCVDKENRDVPQECLNVVNMAIHMIKVITEVNQEHQSQLNMRIGIHTGDISGAITGSTIVRYDIYGIDAAIANKIESGGAPGKIKVSNTTMELLETNYQGKFQYVLDQTLYIDSINRSHDTFFLDYD